MFLHALTARCAHRVIVRDPTTKFRIDDDSGGVTRMRSTTFDMPRVSCDVHDDSRGLNQSRCADCHSMLVLAV